MNNVVGGTTNCGSSACFGDASQAAEGIMCDWRRELNYDFTKTSQYGNVIAWGSVPNPSARGYKVTGYTSGKITDRCDSSMLTIEEIFERCGTMWPSGLGQDNGFYIDSSTCSAVPAEVDSCVNTSGSGGGSSQGTVSTVSCSIGPITKGCNTQCNQCYDNLVDCNENRPDVATSQCMEGDPGKGLKCYCYRPVSTVPVCWAATTYGG